MKKLLKMAKEFLDLSESDGKFVSNNDDTLKEISELEDFDDRIELARKEYEELGEGSARVIFRVSESLILKVAKNDAGLAQNSAEMTMHAECLNNVLAADTDGKWIIMRWTESLTEDEFEELVGLGFKTFMKALIFKANNEIHEDKPNEYEEIIEHPLFKSLFQLVADYDIQVGDISKVSSWGLLENKPILRDFGLTKDVFTEHYDGEENDEASTS